MLYSTKISSILFAHTSIDAVNYQNNHQFWSLWGLIFINACELWEPSLQLVLHQFTQVQICQSRPTHSFCTSYFSRKYVNCCVYGVLRSQSGVCHKGTDLWCRRGAAEGHSTTAGLQAHSLQWWPKQHICHHLISGKRKEWREVGRKQRNTWETHVIM